MSKARGERTSQQLSQQRSQQLTEQVEKLERIGLRELEPARPVGVRVVRNSGQRCAVELRYVGHEAGLNYWCVEGVTFGRDDRLEWDFMPEGAVVGIGRKWLRL